MVVQGCTTLQMSQGYIKEAMYQFPELYLPGKWSNSMFSRVSSKLHWWSLRGLWSFLRGVLVVFDTIEVLRIHQGSYILGFRSFRHLLNLLKSHTITYAIKWIKQVFSLLAEDRKRMFLTPVGLYKFVHLSDYVVHDPYEQVRWFSALEKAFFKR